MVMECYIPILFCPRIQHYSYVQIKLNSTWDTGNWDSSIKAILTRWKENNIGKDKLKLSNSSTIKYLEPYLCSSCNKFEKYAKISICTLPNKWRACH